MGPVRGHAPAALQDQAHVCHHKYEETAKIQQLAMKTVKGTMKIHAVVGLGDGHYATRETSCFKECCYMGGEFVLGCPGWERRVV